MKYEEDSHYGRTIKDQTFLIPWLDQDKLKEVIDTEKLDDLDMFDNSIYPKEIQDHAKQMTIKKIRKHPWYPTFKKMIQKDWIMIEDIAKKLSTKKKKVRYYDVNSMLEKLPEYKINFMKLGGSDYEYYVKLK